MATQSPTTGSHPHDGEEDTIRKVIVLAGPTAVGKSDVAAKLNKAVVVSADSVQAYQGVQIGANKPSLQERLVTPHLLVDIVDKADTVYNVAEWRRDALYAIHKLLLIDDGHSNHSFHDSDDDNTKEVSDSDVLRRQQLIDDEIIKARRIRQVSADERITPVVVGGTMMYVHWLVQGEPDALRPTDVAVEKAITATTQYQNDEDWAGALQFVQSMGENFKQQASKLSDNDWYRLRRIMEVAFTAQEMMTQKLKTDNGGSTTAPDFEKIVQRLYSGDRKGGLAAMKNVDVRCFFLCPEDRMTHFKTIDARCEQMLCKGLIRETTDLSLNGALSDMAARAIGYRQVLDYLSRDDPSENDAKAFVDFVEKFTAATRNYAAQQMKWYRKDPNFVFIPVGGSATDSSETKEERGVQIAKEIERLVQMPRDQFDEEERLSVQSTSAKTRERNLAQGKGMRVFQFKRSILIEGSSSLDEVMKEADLCTQNFQSRKRKAFGSPGNEE